jgi:hypothetical protein
MKYGFIICTLFALAILGCAKDNKPVTPYYPDDYGDFDYVIEGVRDTFVQRLGSTNLFAYVRKKSGPSEDVNFKVEGLPEGVTMTFDPAVAKPPFNMYISIKAEKTSEGVYPIVIVSTSKTSGIKRKGINLTVKPYGNEALALVGPFKETHKCSQSGDLAFNVFIESAFTANNRINIKGFWSSSWTNVVYADLNPGAKTLIIPSQKVNGLEYKGGGTYTEDLLNINYTVADTFGGKVVNESCTATIARQ